MSTVAETSTTSVLQTTNTEPVVQESSVANESSEYYNDFIDLLVAQAEYQDPLDPVDSTEWITQLATYTSLEEQIRSNELLEDILAEIEVGNEANGVTAEGDGSTGGGESTDGDSGSGGAEGTTNQLV